MFYKILKSNSPQYLFKLLTENVLMLKEMLTLFLFNIKHNFYKYSSFPSSIIEWSNLDPKVCNSKNFGIFKNNSLKFIRPKPNRLFNCCNLKRIRLITWLRLGLSHLREHKFKYNFQNCLNTLCSCGSSIESTSHFLLHCPIFHDNRHTHLSTLNNIDSKILESTTDSYLTQTLLFGCTSFDSETNTLVSETNTQPLTIFYPLKDLKKLFFKINLFFHMQLCSPFRTPRGLFHLFFFHFNLSFTFFFCILRHLTFSVHGDCDLPKQSVL